MRVVAVLSLGARCWKRRMHCWFHLVTFALRPLSPKTHFLGMLPIVFIRCVVLGQIEEIARKLMWICPLSFIWLFCQFYIIKWTSSQTLYRSSSHVDCLDQKYGWQRRTLHTPSRKSICAGLCDFRSEVCSANVSGQTRAIFRQKLRCASCWVKSGEFCQSKKKTAFWENSSDFRWKLKMCRFRENRARIGQKIQYADFRANSGGFRSEN